MGTPEHEHPLGDLDRLGHDGSYQLMPSDPDSILRRRAGSDIYREHYSDCIPDQFADPTNLDKWVQKILKRYEEKREEPEK